MWTKAAGWSDVDSSVPPNYGVALLTINNQVYIMGFPEVRVFDGNTWIPLGAAIDPNGRGALLISYNN